METASEVDVLLLEKTGTITIGNRRATHFFSAPGLAPADFARWALAGSMADETPRARAL